MTESDGQMVEGQLGRAPRNPTHLWQGDLPFPGLLLALLFDCVAEHLGPLDLPR